MTQGRGMIIVPLVSMIHPNTYRTTFSDFRPVANPPQHGGWTHGENVVHLFNNTPQMKQRRIDPGDRHMV